MRSISRLALVVVLLVAACPAFAQGSGSAQGSAQGSETSIAVKQPYARATPNGARTGAVYMTLDNKTNTADRLTSASSDVADKLQIHEMAVVNGVMQMRQLADGLPIPAGGSVALKPGSYHVMLIGLKKPLKAGEAFALTLTFAKAGNISLTVPVQAADAAQDNKTGGMEGMGGTQGNKPGGMGNMEMK